MDGAHQGEEHQNNYRTGNHQLQHDLLQQRSGVYVSRGSTVSAPPSPIFSETCARIGSVPSFGGLRVPNISHSPTIAYRPIRPSDLEVLKEMHEALFPIKYNIGSLTFLVRCISEYEAEFFLSVVNGRGIISWAAVDTSRADPLCDKIIGFVTARVVVTSDIDAADMLGYELATVDRTMVYILTLGVIKPYRSLGIASAMMWEVIEYASSIATCRAIYLHVITYNETAIHFYKKNSFQCLRKLQNFYFINGHHYDAYLYIYYVNGGRSPCTALDFLMSVTGFIRSTLASVAGRFLPARETNKVTKWPTATEVGNPSSPGCRLHVPVISISAHLGATGKELDKESDGGSVECLEASPKEPGWSSGR